MKLSFITKQFATSLLVVFTLNLAQAQNLLNLNEWTVGQGSTGIFLANGQDSENIREWGEGPHGNRVVLWSAQPEGNRNDDGGWNSQPFPINHLLMYRFTVWIKKTNSDDGYTYLGCHYVNNLNGSENNNPYFWESKLPELNKWYLLVGYVHGSNDNSTTSYGGIYDGSTGLKVLGCTDYKFPPGATTSIHRSYLFYDSNTNDRQYFYSPRVEIVNGNEPSVEALLGLGGSKHGNAQFMGKVGIQTNNTGDYELAVNGKIRAKEVRVESGWSDFVFEKNYRLLPISELELFIVKNKHLPEIPSETEVIKDGVDLGAVHSRLLQKIEELTLYIIQLNKEIQELKKVNSKNKESNF